MEPITWDDSFSVGVKELNEQHKQLIDMMNNLIRLNKMRVDSEEISDTLTEMTKYADIHFKTEEQYMQKYDYPDFNSHKEQHKDFIKNTVKFCMGAMAYKETIPVEVLTFLKNWWINHILKTDMQYKAFFNEKGVE